MRGSRMFYIVYVADPALFNRMHIFAKSTTFFCHSPKNSPHFPPTYFIKVKEMNQNHQQFKTFTIAMSIDKKKNTTRNSS